MTLPVRIRNGYWGMGDNVMQLPLVRQLAREFPQVYLATPWPQMYWEFPNVRFLDPRKENPELAGWTHFRENIDHQSNSLWSPLPPDYVERWWGYAPARESTRLRATCPMIELPDRVETRFGLKDEWTSSAKKWLDDNVPSGPRVLLHVPTTTPGQELSRDARFEYFELIFETFGDRVSFFDAARTEPGACEQIGHLPIPTFPSFGPKVTTLWALSSLADAIVTSPCHFGDLALAFSRPTLLLQGGCMSAEHIYDPRQDLSKMIVVKPDPFCECGEAEHECRKELDRLAVIEGFELVLSMT